MMSHEDLLRELELLPVWQLSTPSSNVASATEERSDHLSKEAEGETTAELQRSLRLILSDDKQWLFLLAESLDHEAERLLQNMLKAVGISSYHDTVITHRNKLTEYSAKVIVVMGESEAQQLLNDKRAITELRGNKYMLMETPLVVTYSAQHLLENLPDKAKAWEDLCLAKLTIANL